MSDPEAKGRIPGCRSLVNRAIAVNPVILNFKETKARADAFFYECWAEPDTKSFLLHLLGYTTAIFDNAAEFRLLFVNAYPEIEASYVPDLQSFVDPLLNNVRLYAQPRCDPSGLKVYLFWVWTRLAARIEHWKAEALHEIGELESLDSLPLWQQPKLAQSGPDAAAIPLECKNIAFLREKAKLSFRGLAEETGTLDHRAVSKHCHGRRQPTNDTLAKYAEVFSRKLGKKITADNMRSVDLRRRYSDQ
jgi:hypothetical protein